jgi:hypothetical protein
MAASFVAQVDKEMTTFTASVYKTVSRFADIAADAHGTRLREDDFKRLKEAQLNHGLQEDLGSNNEEE